MTLLSAIPSLTPTLDDYVYAADADLGGSPTEQADGRVTFTAIRNLLQANLTTATVTVAAANTAALVSTGYSLTGSSAVSMISGTGTWNTTGTPTLLDYDVTDTASNAAALLMDLKVGGATKLKVDKTGTIYVLQPASYLTPILRGSTNATGVGVSSVTKVNMISNGVGIAVFNFNTVLGMMMKNDLPICWSNANINGAADTFLYRDAAYVIAQRSSSNAQAFRVYSTWTNASNYERVVLDAGKTTSSVHRLLSEAGGTGTIRPIAIDAYAMAGAPTATELPSGTWGVFKDSSGGSPGNVVIAYNDEGNILTASLT